MQRPNLVQYCACTHYMSQANYSHRLRTWVCTQCSQYSLVHHRVNYGAACQMTTGRTNFRFNGSPQNPVCI